MVLLSQHLFATRLSAYRTNEQLTALVLVKQFSGLCPFRKITCYRLREEVYQ